LVGIGTAGGGLNRLKDGKFTTYTTKDGLSSNLVRGAAEDDQGNLWIGTDGAGLNVLRNGRFTTYSHKNAYPTTLFYRWRRIGTENIWIGTAEGCAV